MARNDNPRDPYEVALDISLIATDRVQRTVMRRDVVLERARLAMRRAEAALISAKYGSKERDAEMREATRHQAERFTRAFEVAERSYVEPVDVGDDEVVIHGIVHGAKGHKLEVHALGPGDRSLATGTTNEHGYFKLSSDAEKAHEAATTTRLPVVGDAQATTTAKIRLSVRRDDKELYREKEAFTVRRGRAVYRELDVDLKEG